MLLSIITNTIRIMLQGTEMVFKVSETALKDALKFAKWLVMLIPNATKWTIDFTERLTKRKLTKEELAEIKRLNSKLNAGAVGLDEFMQRYHAQERTILNIPDKYMEEFAQKAKFPKTEQKQNFIDATKSRITDKMPDAIKDKLKKEEMDKGLSYAVLPDLNFSDGMFQVMVPNEQLDIAQSILDYLSSIHQDERAEEIKKSEEMFQTAEQKFKQAEAAKNVAEREGKPANNPEEYKAIYNTYKNAELEMNKAREELNKVKSQTPSTMPIEEYMNTNKAVFDHSDVANEMVNKGVQPDGCSKVIDFVSPDMDKRQEDDICIVCPEAPLSIHRIKEQDGLSYTLKLNNEDIQKLKITDKTTENDIKRFSDIAMAKERELGVNEPGKEWFMCPVGKENEIKEIVKKKAEERKVEEPVAVENQLKEIKKSLAVGELAKDETYVVIDSKTVTPFYDEKGLHTGYKLFGADDNYMYIPDRNSIGRTRDGDAILRLTEEKYEIRDMKHNMIDTITGKNEISNYISSSSEKAREAMGKIKERMTSLSETNMGRR